MAARVGATNVGVTIHCTLQELNGNGKKLELWFKASVSRPTPIVALLSRAEVSQDCIACNMRSDLKHTVHD